MAVTDFGFKTVDWKAKTGMRGFIRVRCYVNNPPGKIGRANWKRRKYFFKHNKGQNTLGFSDRDP